MTVTDYDVADEQQDATPETLDAATLALQVAVDQLTQPGLERLDRSRPEADDAVKAAEAEHTRTAAEELARDEFRQAKLLKQHADFKARGDAVGDRLAQRVRTTLVALRLQMRANADERERRAQARAVTQATLPSLIEQLQDAVEASARGSGATPRSVHRIPIDPRAAELAGEIRWAIGARPDDDLAVKIRAWSDAVVDEQDPTALPRAAYLAGHHRDGWVKRIRDIVTPATIEEVATDPCPSCGNWWMWAPDDAGETVRKAVLQIHHGRPTPTGQVEGGWIRCAWHSCGALWPQTHYDHFARLIHQKRQERAEAEAQRREAG